MSTHASMEGWGISLQGEERDLQVCADMMPEGSDPWIQKIDEDGEVLYVLRSGDLDQCTSHIEIHMESGVVRSCFAGALTALSLTGSIKTGTVLKINADGTKQPSFFASGNFTIPAFRASGTVTNSAVRADRDDKETGPTDLQKLISNKSPEVVDALTYLSKSDDWFDLYKLWEVMKQNYQGGDNSLKTDYPASRDEFNAFTTTMNYHRHHGNIMRDDALSFDGCKRFAVALFKFWISSPKRGPQRGRK